jgi:LacI family transcriptional regulator
VPTTLQDIADKTGLSMMTVSRAIRGQGYVSAPTRDKVLKTAKALNYEINVLAQNFARKRSGFIGLAVPFSLIGSNYFGEIIRGFQRVFDGGSRNFSLFDTQSATFNDGSKLEKLWRARAVEGLLVVAPNTHDKYLDTFTELKMPLIVVGKTVANSKICCIGCDDYRGIQQLCEHLYGLGHRKIAFISGPAGFSVAETRERAYLDFCRDKKLKMPDGFVYRGDYSTRSGREGGLALLTAGEKPTAIIAANDMMAMAAIESARELGVEVPGRVSIAGFDDLPMTAHHFPPLTTLHQPVAEIAERSARLLLDWLDTGKSPKGPETLPVSLVVRGSTAKPSKG